MSGGTSSRCRRTRRRDAPAPLPRESTGGAVFRKGVWGENKNPPQKWEIYPTITKPVEAASDHAAIYADLDL